MRLPSDAKHFLPESLSEKTKNELQKSGLSPAEMGKVFENVVDKINHGSVDSIDKLVEMAIIG